MVVVENVLDLVGRTPVVRLRRTVPSGSAEILAKLEFFNPGRSVKDRSAVGLLADAERTGRLRPGGTIIEATSGNTGIALALAAASRGYRLVVTIPDKMSQDKVRTLRALGAEVRVTPTVAHDDPASYISVAKRLAKEISGSVYLDQVNNPAAVTAHNATGQEILDDVPNVDAIVAGAGTGGTLTGLAQVVTKRAPKVEIIGVEPEGSVFSGGSPKKYLTEGIGYDFVPATLDLSLVDAWEVVGDRDAFVAARRLTREEGLFVGGSSGSAFVAACRVAKRLGAGKRVVTLFPDGGERYLASIYDDAWFFEKFPKERPPARATVGGAAR